MQAIKQLPIPSATLGPLPITNYQLPITNYQFPISNFQNPIFNTVRT
ncbi:MAG: hypothetical protein HC942_03010 [Microcoleus sp. SU_5_6]|nr:hypothetical protein [Microcoleus sp. SU_5_6]